MLTQEKCFGLAACQLDTIYPRLLTRANAHDHATQGIRHGIRLGKFRGDGRQDQTELENINNKMCYMQATTS